MYNIIIIIVHVHIFMYSDFFQILILEKAQVSNLYF